jgi:hypothetical protein
MDVAGCGSNAVFAVVMGSLFSQVPSDAAPGWLSVVIQLGSFGLVAYLIIRGLPALQSDIKIERREERMDFLKALEKLTEDRKLERTDFANAMKVLIEFTRNEVEAIRASARHEVELLRTTFQQEQRDTRLFYAAEAKSMREMYFDSVGAMRTAVHDVRDVANATVNKANVAIEVAKVNKG